MGTKERRAQEKQLRLDQILAAARQLLFSHGINQISISRIAKTAELGVGTIYFYFKSKEEIFVALQEEGLSLFYETIEKIDQKSAAADEKLEKIAHAFYTFTSDQKDYYDVINYFLSSSREFFEPELKNRIDMSGSNILSKIESIIEQGITQGLFNTDTPKKFAVFFFGALHGLMQFKKLERTALAGENHQEIYTFSVHQMISSLKFKT